MNAARLWTFGSLVIIVALLVATWLVGISPRLDEAAQANTDRETVEVQNGIQQVTLASLKKQFENIGELRDQLAELRTAIPAEVALADLVGELNVLAKRAGVVVTSLGFSDPVAYAPVEDPNADAEATAALGSVSPETFFAIPVQLTVSGEYAKALRFVSLLQSADRFFLVDGLTLASGVMVSDAAVELSLSGQVFVLLDASAAEAADGEQPAAAPAAGEATPTAPAPAPTVTPAPTETAPAS